MIRYQSCKTVQVNCLRRPPSYYNLVVVQNLYYRENTPPKWTQQLSSLNWNLNETVSTVPLQPFREAGAAMLERRLVSPMAGKDISRPQREGRLGKP